MKAAVIVFSLAVAIPAFGQNPSAATTRTLDESPAITSREIGKADGLLNTKLTKNNEHSSATSTRALLDGFFTGNSLSPSTPIHPQKDPGVTYQLIVSFLTLLALFAIFQILVIDRRPKNPNSNLITEKTQLLSDLRIITTDFRLFKKILSVVSFRGVKSSYDSTTERELISKFENLDAIDFKHLDLSKHFSELESQFQRDSEGDHKHDVTDDNEKNPTYHAQLQLGIEEIDKGILSSRLDAVMEKIRTMKDKTAKDNYQSTGGLRALIEETQSTFLYRFLFIFVLAVIAYALVTFVPTLSFFTLLALIITLIVASLLIID